MADGMDGVPESIQGEPTMDSDPDPNVSIADAPSGPPGSMTPTYDAGYVAPVASIGDFVWLDADHDTIQDAGEPGIPGVTVHLLDTGGNPVLDPATNLPVTTVTAPDGGYSFDGLSPDMAYKVSFDPTTGDTSADEPSGP